MSKLLDKGEKKLEHIEIARGIAITLVVIGHTSSPLTNFIYLFHLAVFFFISGYLFKDRNIHYPLQFVTKRLKSLYFPFLLYCFVFIAIHNFLLKIGVYSSEVIGRFFVPYYTVKEYFSVFFNVITFGNTEQLLLPMWFLTCLFTVNILFFCISWIAQKQILFKAQITALILSSVSLGIGFYLIYSHVFLYRQFDISLIVLFLFYLGYVFRRWEKISFYRWELAIISFLSLVISSFQGKINIITYDFINPIFFLVNSILGIYFIFFLSHFLSLRISRVRNFFILLGQNSLHILALHFSAFKLVSFLLILIFQLPFISLAEYPIIESMKVFWPIYSIIGVIFPLGCVLLIRRIKIANYFRDFLKIARTSFSGRSR